MRRMSYLSTAMTLLWSGLFASPNWPNEQAGSTTVCNWPFDSVSGKGPFSPSGGGGRIAQDPTAQLSPANVWRNTRNTSMNEAGLVEYNLPAAYQNEVFYGYWFKPSDPHYGWFGWYQKLSLVNDAAPHIYTKMTDIDPAKGTFTIIGAEERQVMVTDANNAHITPNGVLPANVHNETYHVGQWLRMEIYCKRSTTISSRNGIFRWWVNGILAGNYTTLNFEVPLRKVVLSNIWDSVYPALPYEEYVQYDHLYVSLPPGVLQPLTISTASLAAGNTGAKYIATLKADGGYPPYTWSLESGAPPAGMNFYPSTGFISGTPAEGGTTSLVFKVTDAFKATATKTLPLVINGQSVISVNNGRIQSDGIVFSAQAAYGQTRFNFHSANDGNFSIAVFDLQGRNVWKYSGPAGNGLLVQAVWNHGGKPTKGVYLVRAEQNGKTLSRNYCNTW